MIKPRYHNVSVSKIVLLILTAMKSDHNLMCLLYKNLFKSYFPQKNNFYSILLLLSRVLLGFFGTKQTCKKNNWPIRAKALTLT